MLDQIAEQLAIRGERPYHVLAELADAAERSASAIVRFRFPLPLHCPYLKCAEFKN